MRDQAEFVRNLLDWYDENARELPWRIPPRANRRADPYAVWLSEIMLQQTTVVTVIPYFNAFLRRWPTIQALAAGSDAAVLAAWAGLGYYTRARNLIKCARFVTEQFDGVFPEQEAELLTLPGIGPYTAAAISAIAFGHPATVVDGNVERVMARIFEVEQPLPEAKPTLKAHATNLTPALRAGDYAQALMDLGARICTPKRLRCDACPVIQHCAAQKAGSAAGLPKRTPKKPKPTRYGTVYFVMRSDGAVLLETRPDKGLLGGMLSLPSDDWAEVAPELSPPIMANWQTLSAPVNHVFTHFKLVLSVQITSVDPDIPPLRGEFTQKPDQTALPSVMRKAYQVGYAAVCDNLGVEKPLK